MKTVTLLLVSLAAALPAGAAVPPDLAALAKQIEAFPSTRGRQSDGARLARLFDLYWAARMRELPDEATYLGYPGVDDRLPDLSPAGLALLHRLSHVELAALDSIDSARLSPPERLNAEILHRRLVLEIEGERFHSFDPWHDDYQLVDPMNDRIVSALDLLTAMPSRTVADYEAMLARLRAFPAFADQGIERLREGARLGITPPRITLRKVPEAVLAYIAKEPLQGPVLQPFRQIPETIPPPERARLRTEASELFANQVVPVLRKLQDYLARSYVPAARETIAMRDLPDGAAWYAWLLRYNTTTDLTPEQIHELGLAEVRRIRGEMDAVIVSTGFHGGFGAFTDKLRSDPRFYYDKPEDVVAGYREIAKRIDPGLPGLFGRLPRMPYGVKAMEGPTATWPSALYEAGSPAGGRPGWMLVNTYDLHARPKWGMESLAAHESVPGHHLQISLADELTDLPPWRRAATYPAYSEGWAFYAESLGGELGLYQDPYSKFGQLNNEMWRAIRLVVDTGLQTKGWTRQQTIDYCRANSAKTALEIENEVDRYIVQPGSAPAYKIGQLEIRRLRREAEAELGPRFDVRAFHDHVLGSGPLPLDLLAQSVHDWVASVGGRASGVPCHAANGAAQQLLAHAVSLPRDHNLADSSLAGERQVQLHAVIHHFRRDPSALAAFEEDEPVALHGAQGARQVGFGLAGEPRQLVERTRCLLGNHAQQLAIAGRQDLGERLRRGEPDLRLVRRDPPLAACHGHGARLHLLIAGDTHSQRGHGITPLSRNTASTVLQKSARRVAAPRYS